jgi:hypothetical protein
MKNKVHGSIALTVIAILLASSGCTKVTKTPPSQTAQFGLHLHTYIDTNLISPGVPTGNGFPLYQQEFPDHAGRYEYFTQANIYITNVSLHSTTKGWVTVPGSLILKRIENEPYTLGNILSDTYDSAAFTVGLGPNYDNTSPSSHSATSSQPDTVLSSLESVMYNGTGNGYYFLSLTGFVDTSAGQHNVNPIPFSYRLGTNGDTLRVIIPSEPIAANNIFTLPPSSQVPTVQLVHIIFDYGKLIQSFPITAPVNVNSFTSPSGTWMPIWNMVPGMFRFECYIPNGLC